jgi:hypothetical protein
MKMSDGISINDLKAGQLYLWSPAAGDIRTWVPFFDFSDLNRSSERPKADTVIMYLVRENTGSLLAYMFLIGEKKFAVYNRDFRYGLRAVA